MSPTDTKCKLGTLIDWRFDRQTVPSTTKTSRLFLCPISATLWMYIGIHGGIAQLMLTIVNSQRAKSYWFDSGVPEKLFESVCIR